MCPSHPPETRSSAAGQTSELDVFTPWLRDTLRNQEVPGIPPRGNACVGRILLLFGWVAVHGWTHSSRFRRSSRQSSRICVSTAFIAGMGWLACPLRAEVKQLFCWDVPASVGGRRQVAALEQFGRSPCYRASENIPMGGIVSVSKPEG